LIRGVALMVAVPTFAQAGAALDGEFCGRLKAFEAATFSLGRDHLPIRHFVEFQWSDSWLTGGAWGCRHSTDTGAKSFCSYLVDHTNQEFPVGLPVQVLKCHGYVFPSYSTDWRDWTADIRLPVSAKDRSVNLEIYLIHGSVDAAARISVVPDMPSGDDKEPPPLRSTPSVADEAP
jgi:hypothetical protein